MTKKNRRPVAIDLFAGAGGLSLGFEQAGFDVAVALEYDPIHAAVHEFNFPETKILCADAAKTSGKDLLDAARDALRTSGRKDWDGVVDCVIGGPPCQGASSAGHRRVDDERNGLMFEFARLVKEVAPRHFVMENVPGLLMGAHKTEILDRVVARLARFEYKVAAPVRALNAADFGVPQDRQRVFVLGWNKYRGGNQLDYPAPTHTPPAKKPGARPLAAKDGLPPGATVRDAIADLPDLDNYEELLESDEVAPGGRFAELEWNRFPYAARLRNPWGDGSDDLSTPRAWDPSRLTSSNRTTHDPRCVARFERTGQGEVEPVSRFYRLHWEGLSCTLRAGTGRERGAFNAPRPLHPGMARVISVREAMRLHGYPDWFRLHVTKWHGFRQAGNSVPPPLACAVARQVVSALGLSPARRPGPIALGDPRLLALDMTAAAEHFGVASDALPGARRRVAAN